MAEVPALAYPEWTEFQKKNGLDPLGMQASSITLYQTLLPGISNVTLRVRYYGLYTWLCHAYASQVGDTNPITWQRYVRRAEALYALIAQHTGGETGVAGIRWATKKLESVDSGTVEFAKDAEPGGTSPYLKQAWGAYGAAYASQLFAVGLLGSVEGHVLPVPGPKYGDQMVQAFQDALGDSATLFFESVRRGSISIADLGSLSAMTPSRIDEHSEERACYQRLLFAEAGLEREPDLERRRTLLLVLASARHLRCVPTVSDTRWLLYAGCDKSGLSLPITSDVLRLQRTRWWVYQANDLTHISYEALLKYTLDVLESYPAGSTLETLLGHVVSKLREEPGSWPKTWAAFREQSGIADNPIDAGVPNSEKNVCDAVLQAARADRVCPPGGAWSALRLLALVHNRVRAEVPSALSELRALDPQAFQSLFTELVFLESRKDHEFSKLVASLIERRIIRRHLWVALRKLRYQGDYTFLIDADDGRVRLRVKDGPVFTNPRLGPAITFLKDLRLIGDEGVTAEGEKVLDAA